jgi:predicted SAM-dependent methyltransferase
MKIHLACGSVYLDGYINCDAWGEKASDILINPNITTLDNYYKRPFEQDQTKRVRTEPIIDIEMNLLEKWPFKDNEVEEIVMICCIEHFSYKQAQFILSEVKRVLKPNGAWKVDFPNLRRVILEYCHQPEYMMELIYCNAKNEFSFHKWGYTEESFRKFLGEGWRVIDFAPIVKHDYPMTGCTCIKGERW